MGHQQRYHVLNQELNGREQHLLWDSEQQKQIRINVYETGDLRVLDGDFNPLEREVLTDLWDAAQQVNPSRKRLRNALRVFRDPRSPSQTQKTYVSREERRRIKNAFRGFDGKMTSKVRDTVESFEFAYKGINKHHKFVHQKGFVYSMSCTPAVNQWRCQVDSFTTTLRRIRKQER